MDRILACKGVVLPAYINDALDKKSISSFNMGFFGGNDLSFIKHYCDEVFRFMETNRMNDSENPVSKVDCNVFFEQVFLATLADLWGIRVGVLGRPMRDEGYGFDEFCDLTHYGEQPFFHVLGGHKRNLYICSLLKQTLWRKFPEYIWRIYNLDSVNHRRLMTSGQYSVPAMSVERSLAYYEDFLFSSYEKWIQLEPRRVFEMERKAWQDYDKFSAAKKGNKGDFCVSLNPYARSFVPPVQWNIAATTILKSKLRATDFVGFKILVCPCVGNDGIKEVAVGDFGSNILTLLAEGQLQIHLISQILKDYVDLDVFKESDVESLVNKEILYLLSNNLITLNY